jgi:uncharacterized damage-inducible protein DinB
MTREEVVQLFSHMEWADSLIWDSVLSTDAAVDDRAVIERLHHVHVVQRIYLQMWRGTPDRGRELATFADLAEVKAWAREYYRDLWAFVEQIDSQTLSRQVHFPWADELVKWFGEARSATVQETIVQVAMHTSHHRGQLCTMIRGRNGDPPLVDFIGWIWMGKPQATWQSLVTPEKSGKSRGA